MPTRRPSSATVSEARSAAASSGFPTFACAATVARIGRARLVAENTLSVDDLIWPLFVVEGKATRVPVATMPGVERVSVDLIVEAARQAADLGIPALALFPYTDPKLRTDDAREAFNPDNLVCRATRAVREAGARRRRHLDVALDPYTSHGHDGLMRRRRDRQRRDARCLGQAEPGAGRSRLRHPRAVGHDGRAHRRHPREPSNGAGHRNTQIMAYAAKYASAFYGPFRDAVGSSATLKGDKRTYQMDPANTDEALREVALDIAEGADMVMVKPGMPYLDIVRRVKDDLQGADVRLPGLGRVRDADGRRRARLARRRQGDAGEPSGVQARGCRRHPHLFRAARCEDIAGHGLTPSWRAAVTGSSTTIRGGAASSLRIDDRPDRAP